MKKNHLFLLFIIGILILSLCSCGSITEPQSDTPNTQTGTAEEELTEMLKHHYLEQFDSFEELQEAKSIVEDSYENADELLQEKFQFSKQDLKNMFDTISDWNIIYPDEESGYSVTSVTYLLDNEESGCFSCIYANQEKAYIVIQCRAIDDPKSENYCKDYPVVKTLKLSEAEICLHKPYNSEGKPAENSSISVCGSIKTPNSVISIEFSLAADTDIEEYLHILPLKEIIK